MLTTQQLDDLAVVLDPSLLMEDLGFTPDAWQRRVLRSRSRRLLICASRQVGKSTTTAILGLHAALYHPGATVVVVSPSQRQSSELFLKLAGFYGALGHPVPREHETKTTLSLGNGSRVVALPGSPTTIRCFSGVHTAIVDEAALVPDALLVAVSPMLAASRGKLVLLGSPMGQRGYFHAEWARAGGDFEKVAVTADRCPRISPEFLVEERRTLGERMYRQEYFCEFVAAVDQVFSTEAVAAAFADDVAPLFPGTRANP
jgi:hypothetical protein